MGSESSFKPVINLGNSIVGVSILAIPYCFSQCGVVLGSLLVFFNALLTVWSCKMLIRAANMTRSHTYETLALAVFGKMGKLVIEISIIALNIGTCIAYFVIIGDLAPPIIAKLFGIHVTPSTFRATLLVFSALFVAFPLGLLRNIDSLSAISIMSLIFYFSLTIEVVYLSTTNIKSGMWRSKIVWWSWSGILKCLPILSLAFACHTSLHDSGVRRMSVITERAVAMICLIYLVVGLAGYITYCNEEIKGDILANFSLDLISQLTRLGFALSVVVSFPLMIFPCRASINSLVCSQAPNELHVQEPIPQNRFIYITAGIVGTTVVIAILIPNIETVLALTGATTGSLICFIFPGLLFLRVAGSSADYSSRAKIVLAIGLVSMVLSTAVVIHTESVRGAEVESPLDIDVKKPDIIKLPPLPPKVPEEEQNIKGDSNNVQDEGGGGIVDGGEDRRKEPPLPEQPKKEDIDKIDVVKPVEPVKLDNPGNDVIDIPPNGGEVKQHKPAEPDSQDRQLQMKAGGDAKENPKVKGNQEEKEQEEIHLKKKESDGEQEVKKVDKVHKGEGGKVEGGEQEVVHERLEKHLEKLSNRVDQLEEENRELREKQEVMERIHELEEDGRKDVEKVNELVPANAANNVAPKEDKAKADVHHDLAKENVHRDLVKGEKKENEVAAVERDDIVNLNKPEQAILEVLEKDDKEKAKNEQVAEEKNHEVERRAAAPEVGQGKREGAGNDGTHTEQAQVKPIEGEKGGDLEGDVGDGNLKIGDVQLVQEEELGDNAGNIPPGKDGEDQGKEGEKVESYRKRDILNVVAEKSR